MFRGCAEAMYKHDYGCDREMQVSDVGGGGDDDGGGDVSDGEDLEMQVSGHDHHHQHHIVGHWWR